MEREKGRPVAVWVRREELVHVNGMVRIPWYAMRMLLQSVVEERRLKVLLSWTMRATME